MKKKPIKKTQTCFKLVQASWRRESSYLHTRELPWLASMEVDLDEGAVEDLVIMVIRDLLQEIMANQLLITWIEPEPWWQTSPNVSQPSYHDCKSEKGFCFVF